MHRFGLDDSLGSFGVCAMVAWLACLALAQWQGAADVAPASATPPAALAVVPAAAPAAADRATQMAAVPR